MDKKPEAKQLPRTPKKVQVEDLITQRPFSPVETKPGKDGRQVRPYYQRKGQGYLRFNTNRRSDKK